MINKNINTNTVAKRKKQDNEQMNHGKTYKIGIYCLKYGVLCRKVYLLFQNKAL